MKNKKLIEEGKRAYAEKEEQQLRVQCMDFALRYPTTHTDSAIERAKKIYDFIKTGKIAE